MEMILRGALRSAAREPSAERRGFLLKPFPRPCGLGSIILPLRGLLTSDFEFLLIADLRLISGLRLRSSPFLLTEFTSSDSDLLDNAPAVPS